MTQPPIADRMPALQMDSIAMSFGPVQAVTDGNLSLHWGRVTALLGANGAGKSTMMNILGGVLSPTSGSIRLDGVPLSLRTPRDAARAGIAFVQQELAVFPTMTVAENVFVGSYPGRMGRIDRTVMRTETERLLARLGARFSPDTVTETLSTGDRQMVEIARALRGSPRIMIFDEPTSSLSAREKDRLHEVIRSLRAEGVAVVYITHFISEIFGVCDDVAIMRNGATVLQAPLAGLDQKAIVEAMLGDIAATERIAGASPDTAPVLRVTGLRLANRVEHADFDLRKGEILGIWGLLGAGRTELVRALLGLDGTPDGQVLLDTGGGLRPAAPDEVRAVSAFVTEDRRGEGLLLPFSVSDNIALPNLRELSDAAGRVRRGALRSLAQDMIGRLSIKVPSPARPVRTLSGGNQQKVVFAKWLATEPLILILDEPTRGLDLGAKADILRFTVELAAQGVSVLIISSEPEELMRVSHRYLVLRERRTVGTLPATATKEDLIAALSADTGQSGAAA
jgi:ABC-type sugar transport system ATPase subunit